MYSREHNGISKLAISDFRTSVKPLNLNRKVVKNAFFIHS